MFSKHYYTELIFLTYTLLSSKLQQTKHLNKFIIRIYRPYLCVKSKHLGTATSHENNTSIIIICYAILSKVTMSFLNWFKYYSLEHNQPKTYIELFKIKFKYIMIYG